MRKITSLLVLLILAFVGAGSAMADVVAGKVYTIRPYSANSRYLVPVASWAATGEDKVTYANEATAESGQWLVKKSDEDDNFTISRACDRNATGDIGYLNPWSAGTSGNIGCWKTNKGDDRWIITEVEGHEGVYTLKSTVQTAVYMYYNAESELLQYNKPAEVGETNWFYFDEVVVTTPEVPETPAIVSYKTFITSPAPENGEFVSGTKFYTIKVQRDGYLASDRSSNGFLTMHNTTKPTNDAGKWAFVETANGLQLYNKAAGANQVLTFQSSDNSAHCSMGSNLTAATSYFECITSQNSQFATGYECFKIKGTEAYWNHSNNNPYYLNVWTSDQALWGWGNSAAKPGAGDAGSQFKIELAEEIKTSTYTINVVGAPSDVTVRINGEVKPIGTPFSLQSSVTASAVTATDIDFYDYAVEVSGDIITITYTPWPNYYYNRAFVGVRHTNANRQISQIKLGDQEATIDGAGNVYQDLTSDVTFRIEAGQEVKPAIIWNGAWMHGYVFVDTNSSDFQFTPTELVSSAPMPSPERNVDLATEFNGFSIATPGTYRMRYMVAWNSTDPKGPTTIIENSGYILDMLLEVVAPTDKANVTYKYVVDGKEIAKTVVNEQTIGEHVAAQPLTISNTYATVTDNHADLTVAANGSTVVTVNVIQNLPFQVYDPNGTEMPVSALLHVHSNQARILYAEVDANWENGLLWDTTGDIYRGDFEEDGRLYDWYMEGNVVEGFKLACFAGYVNVAANQQATLSDEATVFDLRPSTRGVGGRNFKNGFCLAIAGSNNFLNAQTKIENGNRTTGVKTWTSADEGSTFEFETAYDFTISEAGYATLFYHSPLHLPEAVKGYSLVREGDYLVATELQNNFVPSATGVVLQGAAGNYTAEVTTACGNAAIENSVLEGRYLDGADGINDRTYVLAVGTDGAYFAKFKGSKLGEFKAYYQAPAESASNLRITFDELTGIISAAQQNGGQAIYDLQGRRVMKAQNGIFIQNGKKVVK